MHVSGRATIDAPRAGVFAAVCDPRALLEIIPGCREISEVSPGEYRGSIRLRLPGFVGSYDTHVRMVESDPPSHGRFVGQVDGRAGGITGQASFDLADGGAAGTVVTYVGDGVVTGPLAHLDARFVEGIAQSLIDEGLARLGRRSRVDPAP